MGRRIKRKNFTFCRADISDQDGKFLANVKIWEHDAKEEFIEVQSSPALTIGILCNVVIRTVPKPFTYKGRIHEIHGRTIIKIINEEGAESRQSLRYRVKMVASVEGLVCDEKIYPLHTDIEVDVINISKNGMRIRAAKNTFRNGDKILIRMDNNWPGENPLLVMEIVNNEEMTADYTTYGCRFILKDDINLELFVELTHLDKPYAKSRLVANALEAGLFGS